MHSILADGVVGQVEFGEPEWGREYWWFSRMVISFMMVLTPILMELRLRTCGFFLELTLLRLSLNILAFSISGFSPVSWQREKKMSGSVQCYPNVFLVRKWKKWRAYPDAVRCLPSLSWSYTLLLILWSSSAIQTQRHQYFNEQNLHLLK